MSYLFVLNMLKTLVWSLQKVIISRICDLWIDTCWLLQNISITLEIFKVSFRKRHQQVTDVIGEDRLFAVCWPTNNNYPILH